jgi:uncharacterized protein (TIGR02300 family)
LLLTPAVLRGNQLPKFAPWGDFMSTKAERGTKRTCQNPECGSRFYDLNRNPIVCPICQTAYQIEADPLLVAEHSAASEKAAQRKAKKPVYDVEGVKPEDAPDADADDTLVPIEDEAEATVAEEDETFLEAEEEDGTDMSNIIGPVAEEDEQP